MNVDYSVVQALNYHSNDVEKALVVYDVACQWYKHFFSRIDYSQYLDIPSALEVVAAVGKFHLSAHKPECFPRFSLDFITGAGNLDGEILETLWSLFNRVAVTARPKSQAYRQESYDSYMQDSNFKKMIGMGKIFL
jgi:hypothetical protein